MQITITKPIEDFINRQLAKGYADPSEVARQALLRWMEEEDFEPNPPNLREKIDAARQSKFRRFEPKSYSHLISSTDEADS